MVTLEEIRKVEISDASIRRGVEALYKGTDAILQFAEKTIIPVLSNQIKLNNKEKAITGTYYRMYSWIKSAVVMNRRIDFQGAASAARSLFELFLDMKILAADETGEMVEKFHVFPKIEKFRVAKNLTDFCDKNKGKIKQDYSRQRNYMNKLQTVNPIIIKHWGDKKDKKGNLIRPKHWTGKDVKKRAKDLGFEYEKLYMEIYPLLSWYIHSGSTGYGGVNEEGLEACFGYSHHIIQKVFLEATVTCAKAMKIIEAVEGFYDKIDKLQLVPGAVLVKDKIKLLKERKEPF